MPTTSPATLASALLLVALAACGGDAESDRAPAAGPEGDRADARTDTILLEGMPEPIRLELFRTPPDFPLPFSAYVPREMAAETEVEGDGASARFVAEFGGRRNDLAFVHLFVYPEGTDLNAAMGVVRGYEASRGVPVSRGLEPLEDEERSTRMPWAERGFRFRYQSQGQWFVGSIGLATHDGRIFHLIQHYPAEYGDGFGPRAHLIMETWRWSDGSGL